jgi:hypothetical protein
VRQDTVTYTRASPDDVHTRDLRMPRLVGASKAENLTLPAAPATRDAIIGPLLLVALSTTTCMHVRRAKVTALRTEHGVR